MAEVCLGAFSSIVAAKSLFKPIIRQISYVFKYQSYMDGLKDQMEKLGDIKERVQQPVDHARRQGDGIYNDVTKWLNKVDAFSDEVTKPIIDDEDGAKKSCFKGLCPNLLSRYKLGKQAATAADTAVNLVKEGDFRDVSYRPAPNRAEHRDVNDYLAFDSRMKVFQDVVEALKDDKHNIIGVYGMGGVGKTTLVKQVRKQVMDDKMFDKVVMAEVTQTPDHHKIQDKLAFDLGMEFDSNENEFQRASRLCQRLKQEKRLLIILDNIWTKLEFDTVGIPYGDVEKERTDDRSRCTMILTSRNRDLLERDMNSQKNFLIEVLSKEEALQLFENILGDSTKTSTIQPIADEIVKRCGGLPVAVTTVANALKSKSLDIWKDALNQLRSSNPREIDGMDKNVYTSIELSYNLLASKEAKSLFCLCGLYNEGHAIQVASLLRYGMGWGLFENVYTLEEARSRVHRLIDNLKSSCLLLDGGGKDEVKMHDVIHVVAISIATEEQMFNIPNVADVEKKMEETKQKGPIAISLPHRDIQELPERLQCPNLELFLLFRKGYGSMQISDLFFEGTEEVKVLSLTGVRFSSLPSSLGRLFNLQTLCLDGCRLKDIAIVGQLKKLEILSFRDSYIKELPHEIGQLTRLQLLDLSNCRSLVVIAPNLISKFSQLEELYMGDSFSQWDKVEGGSNASLAELKGLSKLTTLEIQVRDAQILPQDLVLVELQRYKICIGEAWRMWGVTSEISRLVRLHGLENVSTLLENYGTKMLLKEAEEIHLNELKGVQNVVHELDDGEGFPRLKRLHVRHCSEILHIVGSVGRVRREVFPLLESLFLSYLNNLETICDSQLTEDQSFSNLRIINVSYCHELKHLFSFSIAKNLRRLQKVAVSSCDDLEMMVGPDREKPTTSLGFNEIIADDDPAPKVRLPRLEVLLIELMDNLRKIWHHQLASESFTKLKNLEIIGCDNLMNIFPPLVQFPSLEELHISSMVKLRKIWQHQLASESFSKLKNLGISVCDNLVNIFPPLVGIPSSLVNLTIRQCEKIEEIIGHVGEEVKENRIAFNELKLLKLYDLPRLKSFCLENYALEFPSLEEVSITHCLNMKTFSQGILSTPKLHEVRVSKNGENELCHWEGNLNFTIQKFYEEMFVQVVFLEKSLKLSHFPRLREIWHNQALSVDCISNLQELVVDDCMNMSSAIPSNLLRYLNKLEDLVVSNCDSLEEVLHLEELNAGVAYFKNFLSIRYLKLIDLPKLKRVCNFTENIIELPKLLTLTIVNCATMETFLSNSTSVLHMTAHHIQPLFDEKVGFPRLGWLKLSRLPNVLCLWNENFKSNKVLPQLNTLKISECSKLQKLGPSLWHLENLGILEVSKCDGLVNLSTLSTSKSLVNLQSMKIADCKTIEEIIQSQVGEEAKDCIVFGKLEYLGLDCLPSLTSFYSGNYTLEFPSLKQVLVRQCPKMKIFSQGIIGTPTLNKVKLTEKEEGCWEGNLNDTIHKLFNEMNSKDKIEPTLQV